MTHPSYRHYRCGWIDPDSEILVWEDVDRYEAGLPPSHICCTRCGEMVETEWNRSSWPSPTRDYVELGAQA